MRHRVRPLRQAVQGLRVDQVTELDAATSVAFMGEAELNAAARLLLTHWDVVGVSDTDVQPEQEYCYEAQQVLALLADGADVGVVAAYLAGQAEQMSGAQASRDQAAASALVEWYRNRR